MCLLERCDFHSSTTSSQHSDSRQLAEPSHWDSLNSPLIQDEGDGKSLKLRFDVSQYTPEEIVVKTVDNKLLVSIIGGYFTIFKKKVLMSSIVDYLKIQHYIVEPASWPKISTAYRMDRSTNNTLIWQ